MEYEIDFPDEVLEFALNDYDGDVEHIVKLLGNFMTKVAVNFPNEIERLKKQSTAFLKDLNEKYDTDYCLPEKNIKVKFSFSTDLSHKYKPYERSWEDMYKVVSSEGNYSASQFRDGHRIKENWLGGNNMIILDIDDLWTIQDAVSFLDNEGLKALVATTKSHQKEKNGIICDRFRILIPTGVGFNGTVDEFSLAMQNIHKYFNEVPDKACKDVSRMYYGVPNCEYYYLEGETLDWGAFKYKIEKKKKIFVQDGDVFKKIKSFIRNIGGLTEGNRNNTLFRIGRWALNEGVSRGEVEKMIRDYNATNPIPESEINILLKNL